MVLVKKPRKKKKLLNAHTAGYEMKSVSGFSTVWGFDDDGMSGIVPACTSSADVEIS